MVEIRPQPAQSQFLSSSADIAIYGGAAGAGKTYAILLEPLYHYDNPQFSAVIFRRTYPEIKNPGGLWDVSFDIYPHCGGVPHESNLSWTFPSGAKVKLSHLQHDKNRLAWQGAQIPLIEWDELTHHSEQSFWYLLSRNRSLSGVRPYVRATTNPDADSWVADLIDWWIGGDGYPLPERSGVPRWFVRVGGELVWANSRDELVDAHPDTLPKSLTFISATIEDNQILLQSNPEYRANLQALHPVERERLERGNWRIRYEAGTVFDRSWFELVDSIPPSVEQVRGWDIAATDKSIAKKGSFYTAGVKLVRVDGVTYVADCVWRQISPAEVPRWLGQIAAQDGPRCRVAYELEGGSESRIASETVFADALKNYNAKAVLPRGSKVERATPLATAAFQGKVRVLRSAWTDQFLAATQGFDGSPKPLVNDLVDAASLAYNQLIEGDLSRFGSSYSKLYG